MSSNGTEYIKEAEKRVERFMEISVNAGSSRSWEQYRSALESLRYAKSRIEVAEAELASALLDAELAKDE